LRDIVDFTAFATYIIKFFCMRAMRNYEILKVAFAEDNLLFEYYVFFSDAYFVTMRFRISFNVQKYV